MNRILNLQEMDVHDDQSETCCSATSAGSTSSCNTCTCEVVPIPV